MSQRFCALYSEIKYEKKKKKKKKKNAEKLFFKK